MNDWPSIRGAVSSGRLVGCAVVLGVAWTAVYVALVLGGYSVHRAAHDAATYHEPTVAAFAEQLSAGGLPDVSDYRSATTPGFHLLLAGLETSVGIGPGVGRALVTACVGGLMMGVAGWVVGSVLPAGRKRFRRSIVCAVLLAPLGVHLTAITSATHTLPDNLAWVFVFGIVGLSLRRVRRWTDVALGTVMMLGLVFVRQSHAWAGGVLMAAAWLDAAPKWSGTGWLTDRTRARLLGAGRGLVASLPALALTLWFVSIWGGLVPPMFQSGGLDPVTGEVIPRNTGTSPWFFVVTLASLGVAGPSYLFVCRRSVMRVLRSRSGALGAAASGLAAMLAAFAVPTSTTSVDTGRFSGWWTITGFVEFGDRSPLMIALAGAGGVVLYLLLKIVRPRTALVISAALVGVTVAHSMTSRSFFRYCEPLVLLLLARACAETMRALTGDPAQRDCAPRPDREELDLLGGLAIGALVAVFVAVVIRPT